MISTVSLIRGAGGETAIVAAPGGVFGRLMMLPAVQRIRDHGLSVNAVIDIGASDGSWSRAVMGYFPNASCLAIEPLRERMAALERLKQKAANFDYELCVAGNK